MVLGMAGDVEPHSWSGRERGWPSAQVEAGRGHSATTARGVPVPASGSADTGEDGRRPATGLGEEAWQLALGGISGGGGELGHRRCRSEAGWSLSVGTPSSRWWIEEEGG